MPPVRALAHLTAMATSSDQVTVHSHRAQSPITAAAQRVQPLARRLSVRSQRLWSFKRRQLSLLSSRLFMKQSRRQSWYSHNLLNTRLFRLNMKLTLTPSSSKRRRLNSYLYPLYTRQSQKPLWFKRLQRSLLQSLQHMKLSAKPLSFSPRLLITLPFRRRMKLLRNLLL